METKKYLKRSFFTLMLVLAGLSFSPISVLAVDWGVGYNSATGSIGVVLGSNGTATGGSGVGLSNPYGLPSGSILGIMSGLLFWLLSIFAIFGIIGFLISGILYLMAGADEGNAEKGKEGMKWSIMGVIVGLSGFIIMQAVSALLSGGSNF